MRKFKKICNRLFIRKVDISMNITMYGLSTNSTRKAYEWLKKHSIQFVYKNILLEQFSIKEIKHIFRLTENGTEDILSTNSKLYKKLIPNINYLSMDELYKLIQENPKLLKYPIIVNQTKIQVGFSDYDIRKFIPKEDREKTLFDLFAVNQDPHIEGV